MSILSKWGFLAGSCVDPVYALYLLITNTHEEVSGYAPDAVANPRIPNGDTTNIGSVCEESG